MTNSVGAGASLAGEHFIRVDSRLNGRAGFCFFFFIKWQTPTALQVATRWG